MAGEDNLTIIRENTIARSKGIIAKTVAMDFDELKKYANIFLQDVLAIYHSGDLQRIHNSGKSETMRLWTIYRDAKTSQALALVKNTFALALDNYLQRTIVLTYVDDKGRILMYTEEGEIEILEKVGKNAGRENLPKGVLLGTRKNTKMPKLYEDFAEGKEGELARLIQTSAAKRQAVYKEAVDRYKENQKYWNRSGNKNVPNKPTRRFYYDDTTPISHPPSGFEIGRMAEAYVEAVAMDRDGDMMGEINKALRDLYGHIEKDTVGAIVKGDVTVDAISGNISLAVKASTASTAMIGQYIVAADKIRKMTAPPEEGWDKWLRELPKINSYAKEVEAAAREEAEKITYEQILKMSLS